MAVPNVYPVLFLLPLKGLSDESMRSSTGSPCFIAATNICPFLFLLPLKLKTALVVPTYVCELLSLSCNCAST